MSQEHTDTAPSTGTNPAAPTDATDAADATDATDATDAAGAIDPDDAAGTTIVVETQPTLKPTVASLAAVLLGGVAALALLFTNPTLLGAVERTEIAANLVVLLTIVAAGRLLLRLYVLTRTRYVLTADSIRREYSLLYKTFSRELPLSKLRSYELRRSRIETALGIGTVAFLTGSVAQSPAHLEFRNVPHPERIRRRVREQLSRDER